MKNTELAYRELEDSFFGSVFGIFMIATGFNAILSYIFIKSFGRLPLGLVAGVSLFFIGIICTIGRHKILSIYKNIHKKELYHNISVQENIEIPPTPIDHLQDKDAIISQLQSELANLRKHICGHGAVSLVVGMLEDGFTKEDIAKHLKEKGGLSYSQVGVLLHENPLSVSNEAISMYAKRLLGIA